MSKDRLIIFTKAPVPGEVKTRLLPRLSPVEAARLHAAFIEDTLDMALSDGTYAVTLAYTPEGSLGRFRDIVDGKNPKLVPQEGAGLGERMHNALSTALATGCARAALIGTDIPTLPPGLIREAFERLGEYDLVLAPTRDGGYCLVSLNRPQPRLFEDMAWSTPRVLEETLARAKSLGLKVFLLPEQSDVDTAEDLAALAVTRLPPNTRRVVSLLRGLPHNNIAPFPGGLPGYYALPT